MPSATVPHCGAARGAALLLALLAAVLPAAGSTVHVSNRMRTHLAEFVRRLPLRGDALDAMSDADRAAWAADPQLSVGATLRALGEAMTTTLTVDVKLVGFDGDSAGGPRVGDHDLQLHLRSLATQLETVALQPTPHPMTVHPTIEFRVAPAYYQLIGRINAALAAQIVAEPASTTFTTAPLSLVRPGAVASILADDFVASQAAAHSTPSYTLYLINPTAAGAYAYSHDKERHSCPGAVHLDTRLRMGFVDLGANISFLGPGPGGRGQVLPHALPSVSHYRGEAASRAIVPDLAALVWSGVNHLVWPPLQHSAVAYNPVVEVALVIMHQAIHGREQYLDKVQLEAELHSAVMDLQQVVVKEYRVDVSDCPECTVGWISALRSRTTLHTESQHVGSKVVRYLDTEALGAWAAGNREAIMQAAGIVTTGADEHGVRILPVFIFDMHSQDPVLLDGWRQAAALANGDVVAVIGGNGDVPSFFGCHHAQLRTNPWDIHRPVLAALLQAGWGVADTAAGWSRATGRAWSHLWSTSATPFGPLSTARELSFVQRDAMARNLVLAALNSSLSHAATLLEGVAHIVGLEASPKAILMPQQIAPYNQRISLLLHKAQSSLAAAARLDWPAAAGYALSGIHDAAALHALLRGAKHDYSRELHCMGPRHRSWAWWALPGGAAVVCAALVAWRVTSELRGGRRASKSHLF